MQSYDGHTFFQACAGARTVRAVYMFVLISREMHPSGLDLAGPIRLALRSDRPQVLRKSSSECRTDVGRALRELAGAGA